jgi:D-tyrosyl-tRNA(Tyr) deacylase
MRAIIQRVESGAVTVGGETVGRIGKGLVILLGVRTTDTADEARWLAKKCAGLRVFEDGEGLMNLGLSDVGGEVLVVSQFTLYGDCGKGRRPSFVEAAQPEKAEALYGAFVETMREQGIRVATGRFREKMLVEIRNDGPVTLIIER